MSFWDIFKDPQQANAIGTGLSVGSQLGMAGSSIIAGNQADQIGKFQAAQLRDNASNAMASSQRTAYFADLDSRYVQSAALAAAAASGGGASDPGVINNIAQIAQMGAYKQQVALYGGEEKSKSLNLAADTAEYEGTQKKASSRGYALGQVLKSGSTLMGGYASGTSLLERFGAGAPKTMWSD